MNKPDIRGTGKLLWISQEPGLINQMAMGLLRKLLIFVAGAPVV